MKLLAPIRALDELEMLASAGAEELYCGIVPREWTDRYQGAAWLNRRAPRNGSLETWRELRDLTGAAAKLSIPVFVTLNAPYYTEDQLPLVADLASRLAAECGVRAFIISDIPLLHRLSQMQLPADLHVSSVAATLNVEAVRFLQEFGPTRIVLPRSVTLAEIREITTAVAGDMEIEVFLLNDGCAFEEGFCATTHHHSVGAFCTSLSTMDAAFEWHGPACSGRRQKWLLKNLADYREWVWYVNGNGCSSTPKGLPYGPCGLCAIGELQRMGVASLKIVGREASPFKKLASVKMAADILRRVRAAEPDSRVIQRARSLRGEPQHCESGYMCYYKV